MSALPPKADMCGALANVSYGPKADMCSVISVRVWATRSPSFMPTNRAVAMITTFATAIASSAGSCSIRRVPRVTLGSGPSRLGFRKVLLIAGMRRPVKKLCQILRSSGFARLSPVIASMTYLIPTYRRSWLGACYATLKYGSTSPVRPRLAPSVFDVPINAIEVDRVPRPAQ